MRVRSGYAAWRHRGGENEKKSRIGFLIVKLNINTETGDALIVIMAGFATARWFAICDGKITE